MTTDLNEELDPLAGIDDPSPVADESAATTEALDSVVDASTQTELVIDEETTTETTGDDAPAAEETTEETE